MENLLQLLDGLTIEQKKQFRDYLRYLSDLECKPMLSSLISSKEKKTTE